MDPTKRLPIDEAFEGLDPQGEFPQSQRPLRGKPTLPQPTQVLWEGVLRPVDDAQVTQELGHFTGPWPQCDPLLPE